jgi:hypothetical protein
MSTCTTRIPATVWGCFTGGVNNPNRVHPGLCREPSFCSATATAMAVDLCEYAESVYGRMFACLLTAYTP